MKNIDYDSASDSGRKIIAAKKWLKGFNITSDDKLNINENESHSTKSKI